MSTEITYSEKYEDKEYEYRHVVVPRCIAKIIPRNRLMSEEEWRKIGIQQSKGWVHYMNHNPEPHIVLFKRPLGTDPTTGKVKEES